MQQPNENGVYQPEMIEELVRRGRSRATVEIALCQDGLYHYALDMAYSYGGFGGPIKEDEEGFVSPRAAKEAAIQKLLKRWPKAWPGDPQSVHDELREMKAVVETAFAQRTLF